MGWETPVVVNLTGHTATKHAPCFFGLPLVTLHAAVFWRYGDKATQNVFYESSVLSRLAD